MNASVFLKVPALAADPYGRAVALTLTAVLGLCVGSFLNVVIYRLPRGMSLAKPPSHCPGCGHRIRFRDNIPLLSYCLLRGRCRHCGARIPFRYAAVEGANTVLWLLCAVRFADSAVLAALAAAVCSICLCVCAIDREFATIHDRFPVALALIGAAWTFLDPVRGPLSHAIGCLAAAVVLVSIAFLTGKAVGREALGGGDIKFAVSAGLLLGWEKLTLMMLIASVGGSAVMLIQRRRRRGRAPEAGTEGRAGGEETPFGPYLTAGLVVALLFGDALIRLYLSVLLG